MTHSVTLEVPDQLYRTLVEKASKKGKEIEEVALDRLSDEWPDDVVDPFEKFIGSLTAETADIPDWADNHDKYIGEAIYREMRGRD